MRKNIHGTGLLIEEAHFLDNRLSSINKHIKTNQINISMLNYKSKTSKNTQRKMVYFFKQTVVRMGRVIAITQSPPKEGA